MNVRGLGDWSKMSRPLGALGICLLMAGCTAEDGEPVGAAASVEEATRATCRDIERWSGEIQDVLAENTDYKAPVDALADFQQSLQTDADMFREAGKETVAERIDDWGSSSGGSGTDREGDTTFESRSHTGLLTPHRTRWRQ